jgi:voltage-gated potassium channel Kch
MSLSFRSVALTIAAVVFFIVLVVAANSTGIFGDALDPFINPFIESTSLTGETFTTGGSGSTARATPTVRR